jgi:hypothetical protein
METNLMKKLMFAVASSSLFSGVALAQPGLTCLINPSDPTCVCVGGETDRECTDGVHRGLMLSTVIRDEVAVSMTGSRAAASLHASK